MLSDQNKQAEASVEPVESAGVEVVVPIPIPEYVNELVTRANMPRADWLPFRLQ